MARPDLQMTPAQPHLDLAGAGKAKLEERPHPSSPSSKQAQASRAPTPAVSCSVPSPKGPSGNQALSMEKPPLQAEFKDRAQMEERAPCPKPPEPTLSRPGTPAGNDDADEESGEKVPGALDPWLEPAKAMQAALPAPHAPPPPPPEDKAAHESGHSSAQASAQVSAQASARNSLHDSALGSAERSTPASSQPSAHGSVRSSAQGAAQASASPQDAILASPHGSAPASPKGSPPGSGHQSPRASAVPSTRTSVRASRQVSARTSAASNAPVSPGAEAARTSLPSEPPSPTSFAHAASPRSPRFPASPVSQASRASRASEHGSTSPVSPTGEEAVAGEQAESPAEARAPQVHPPSSHTDPASPLSGSAPSQPSSPGFEHATLQPTSPPADAKRPVPEAAAEAATTPSSQAGFPASQMSPASACGDPEPTSTVSPASAAASPTSAAASPAHPRPEENLAASDDIPTQGAALALSSRPLTPQQLSQRPPESPKEELPPVEPPARWQAQVSPPSPLQPEEAELEDIPLLLAATAQLSSAALAQFKRGSSEKAVKLFERALKECEGKEQLHPAFAVEVARLRLNYSAALSSEGRSTEALSMIKDAQQDLAQVVSWANDCDGSDPGVAKIGDQARALECAALLAEGIQMEACGSGRPALPQAGGAHFRKGLTGLHSQLYEEASSVANNLPAEHPVANLARQFRQQAGRAVCAPGGAESKPKHGKAKGAPCLSLPPLVEAQATGSARGGEVEADDREALRAWQIGGDFNKRQSITSQQRGNSSEEIQQNASSSPAKKRPQQRRPDEETGRGRRKRENKDIFTAFIREAEAEMDARRAGNETWQEDARKKLLQLHRSTQLLLELSDDKDLKDKKYTNNGHKVMMQSLVKENRSRSDPSLVKEAKRAGAASPEVYQVKKITRDLYVKPSTPPPAPALPGELRGSSALEKGRNKGSQ